MSSQKKVNYLSQTNDRKKMTNYLRTGNFKKISGAPIIGRRVTRRRVLLAVTAILILIIGLYSVIF